MLLMLIGWQRANDTGETAQFLYVQLALPQDAHSLAFGFSGSPQFRQRGAGFVVRDQW
jgi:hypothetical protein